MLKLADKDFKVAILTVPNKVKMVIINKNIFLIRKTENIKKKNPVKILEPKNTVSVLKNSLDGVKSRMEMTRERVSELEERSVEVIQSEKAKNKDSELWTGI